jgi:hypothetical protein
MLTRVLQLSAPYLAVAVFWVGYESAWLTIFAYHLQMLFWTRHRLGDEPGRWNPRAAALLALPAAAAGMLLVALVPHVARGPLSVWLARYGLGGPTLALMIPYFGVVHPILEQSFWSPLRRNSASGHAAFAGYHALVLYTLLPPLWLAVAAGIITLASVVWERANATHRGLLLAMVSHVAADLSIVVTAWVVA